MLRQRGGGVVLRDSQERARVPHSLSHPRKGHACYCALHRTALQSEASSLGKRVPASAGGPQRVPGIAGSGLENTVSAVRKRRGLPLGDILADSGYAHRIPANWAVPLRAAGAQLIQDLHPSDRGPHGTHHGAIISNGSLYCPQAPPVLLQLGPLARGATREQAASHDTRTAELGRYKLGRITSDDPDGYHRVMCPAVMGKIRCPLRPQSLTLDRDRPEILTPPPDPPACCTQQTLTIPPEVTAKTAQKHDYPSAAHRRSYARRTGAERGFATLKDPATSDITRGWCRIMGLAPRLLFTTCLTITRNQRITAAWDRRQ